MRMPILLLTGLVAALMAFADVPADVWKVFTDAAEALANENLSGFLAQVDPNMPGYSALRTNVEALMNGNEVTSTIVPVTDAGDERKRSLELDWLLSVASQENPGMQTTSRRGIVKVRVERQAKGWKIVAIEPADFFRP